MLQAICGKPVILCDIKYLLTFLTFLSLEKLLKNFTSMLNPESATESLYDYVTRMCFYVDSLFLFVAPAQKLT